MSIEKAACCKNGEVFSECMGFAKPVQERVRGFHE